ncbi:hypothetical protein GCM10010991_28620 [Gemmobacter aquaticus]|uniref:Uncharacterized protein n=1 Tax=Gemmobacter aquaticus TaxID=490185 RepID=A0A917YN76_9RHOB|nr:hypothetical protein GCM10010991_28620 [Gemmobacter aquaticus]
MAIKIEYRPTPPWGAPIERVRPERPTTERQIKNAIKVLAEHFDIASGGMIYIHKKGRTVVCSG